VAPRLPAKTSDLVGDGSLDKLNKPTGAYRVVVVVVIGDAMQFGVRENPGRYDNLDNDNDNDNDNDCTRCFT